MKDKCYDCGHEIDSMNYKDGHDYYAGPCKTKTVSGPCKCLVAVRPCSYFKCDDKAIKQYRDQYTPESNPYLCEQHDELRQFIEQCVRGALKKL